MRKAWPRTLHGWSSYSIIRHGEKIILADSAEEDPDRDAVRSEFTNFVKNYTKTAA